MLDNSILYSPIKAGKDAEFRGWFAWSNAKYAKHKGFISRKLLKPRESGNHAAVVEHKSHGTFWAMHTSPTQAEAAKRVMVLLGGDPSPTFYGMVVR
jgi:hypothetical protein